jgi:hypothetical protein
MMAAFFSFCTAAPAVASGPPPDSIDDVELTIDRHAIDALSVSVRLDRNCSVNARALEALISTRLWDRCIRTQRDAPHALEVEVLAHRTNDGEENVALYVVFEILENATPAHGGSRPVPMAAWTRHRLVVAAIDEHVETVNQIVREVVDEAAAFFAPGEDSRCGGEPEAE